MQKYNLLSVIRRKKYRNYGEYLHRYPNLLNRDFHADRPNQKWVTDISYIKTGQGTLYLSVIRDLYDNSIVAYKTGTEQNVNLVLSTIRAAKRKEKVTAELQLHSDQGFQYTSQAYFKLTQSYHITPSMSRRGNPYDNAMAENFFSILKTECIYRTKIRTYEEARLLIGAYIHLYNHERIQLKTKLTPLEKRCQFVAWKLNISTLELFFVLSAQFGAVQPKCPLFFCYVLQIKFGYSLLTRCQSIFLF